MLIVQPGNGSTQRLDSGRGTVFSGGGIDGDRGRTGEASLDLIVDLWGTLAQVCPGRWVVLEAVLIGTLSTPDDTGGGTRSVQASVGTVTFVGGTEITVGFGVLLCSIRQGGSQSRIPSIDPLNVRSWFELLWGEHTTWGK